MTKVLVHGNPETTEVWDPLLPALRALGISDIIMLSPPGFGAPVPAGFAGTRLAYRDWLIGEIERIGHPVDLLGHDWGAGHTYALAAARPDLLRSWSADCAGLIHPSYEWHPAAQVWQREGDGEASIAQIMSMTGDELTKLFGVPAGLAPIMAEHLDATMGASILSLYRSAAQPAAHVSTIVRMGQMLDVAIRRRSRANGQLKSDKGSKSAGRNASCQHSPRARVVGHH